MKTIKMLSLFSGIGAFEKALTNIGINQELVGFSEIDKYAIKSYCAIHNVDSELNLGDITKIEVNKLPRFIDLITHGSPCQDFSIAGKQAGAEKGSGTRSSLMWNTIDIVEWCLPKYVVWENVKNILSKKHKHNFDSYIEIMDKLGYNSYYQVLNAKDYGVPQNRERVYTISVRKDMDNNNFQFPKKQELKLRLKDMLEDEVEGKYYLSDEIVSHFIYETNSTNIIGNLKMNKWQDSMKRIYDIDTYSPAINTMQGGNLEPKILIKNNTKQGYLPAGKGDSVNLAYPNSTTRRGRVGYQVSQTLTANDNMGVLESESRIRKLTPKECWRLMGFSDDDFKKAEQIPTSNTQLYKQAGNSIVVKVLEKIFLNLFKEELEK